jgi:hypothetical protein
MDHEDVDRSQPGREEYARVDRSQLGKGEYADYFEVGHDFVAFYLDLGQQAIPAEEITRVYSRIVTSPIGAISLLGVLAEALCAYAHTYHAYADDKGKVLPKGKEMEAALCDYVERFVQKPQRTTDEIFK